MAVCSKDQPSGVLRFRVMTLPRRAQILLRLPNDRKGSEQMGTGALQWGVLRLTKRRSAKGRLRVEGKRQSANFEDAGPTDPHRLIGAATAVVPRKGRLEVCAVWARTVRGSLSRCVIQRGPKRWRIESKRRMRELFPFRSCSQFCLRAVSPDWNLEAGKGPESLSARAQRGDRVEVPITGLAPRCPDEGS